MTRHYTNAELAAAVRRQAEIDQIYYTDYQNAVRTQNRSWLHQLVKTAVRFVLGSMVGDVLNLGIDFVWDFFADLFSG